MGNDSEERSDQREQPAKAEEAEAPPLEALGRGGLVDHPPEFGVLGVEDVREAVERTSKLVIAGPAAFGL